jgi:hypothetical protein
MDRSSTVSISLKIQLLEEPPIVLSCVPVYMLHISAWLLASICQHPYATICDLHKRLSIT